MNIDKIEKELGKFSGSLNSGLEQLMYLAVINNSLLWTIFENQIEINMKLDPSKTFEEHKAELLKVYENHKDETFNTIARNLKD